MTTTIYVTFGFQYPREPHPLPFADGDGYMTITAQDYATARATAFAITQGKFAFDYETPPKYEHAPLGELANITVNVPTVPEPGVDQL